jgi:hypothetical protein
MEFIRGGVLLCVTVILVCGGSVDEIVEVEGGVI